MVHACKRSSRAWLRQSRRFTSRERAHTAAHQDPCATHQYCFFLMTRPKLSLTDGLFRQASSMLCT